MATNIGTLGFLGFGNMGKAIAKGMVASGAALSKQILVFDPGTPSESLDFPAAKSAEDLFRRADVVVLAVKPQVAREERENWKALFASLSGEGKTFISIMAGVRAASLREIAPRGSVVVRVMPNLGLSVGEGATAIATDGMPPEALELTEAIFGASGTTVRVSEEQMDAVTGLSGSGPMYLFEFVEGLTRAGVAEGFSREAAYALALQTVKGSLKLLETSADAPPVWSARVQSKGGTTEAAKKVLDAGGFQALLAVAVKAAVARSRELSAG